MASPSGFAAPAARSAMRRHAPALVAAVLAIAAVVPPELVTRGPVLCWFRALTGRPCPGCGITRSTFLAAHGRWSAAVREHPLGPLVVAAGVAYTAAAVTGNAARLEALVAKPAVRGGAGAVGVAWMVLALRRFLAG
jgi:hypothetical protein